MSSIDIVCYTASKQKVYKDIVDILNTSKDTKNLKKSDVILIDKMGKQYSISIKNDKSDYWQSADTYLGKQARQIIDDCVSSKRCSLPIITCPHCNKSGRGNRMVAYHWDKCKFKGQLQIS